MKVQIVCSKFPPEYAGAGLRIHNTYRRLAAAGAALRWKVLTNSVEFPGNASYSHDNVPVERIACRFRSLQESGWRQRLAQAWSIWLEAVQTLLRLAGRRYDLLHVFGMSASTAAAILWARLTNAALVIELVTARADPRQSLPGLRYGNLLNLKRRTLIIAISAALGERCRELGFTDNVWVRPNPVDTTRFFPQPQRRDDLRTRLTPFNTQDCVLSMVAKFMPQKNQIFLLDMLAQLPERFKLVLAGPVVTSGPLLSRDEAYMVALRQRILDLNLETRVHLVPNFVTAEDYILLADAYLLPNYDEGLATPMLESLACGVPVLANAAEAAFRQWIDDGRTGFLRPLETAAWVTAARQLPELPAEALAQGAREIADVASAARIDADFHRLLQATARLPRDGQLDVSAVLKASA
ncbi:glycosyltransferase [Ferrovibrio terrae]|uniref:glycosyltransferase n=1 Tax=Ferrovibrio terrae TaxID=2594003 RepID=UPI0031378D96